MDLGKFLCIIFLCLFCNLQAQEEASNWYFGDKAGLKFSTSTVTAIGDGNIMAIEGCAAISDRNGNLLFYTDGEKIFDRSHSLMQNGDGLKGHVSASQSAVIVPRPTMPERYFVFTVDKPNYFEDPDDPIEGVHFSEIDMSLNNGYGAVIAGQKNIHLQTYDTRIPNEVEFKNSEKITAVISGDCTSYWVMTQLGNKFYSFNVNADGVNTEPVISTVSTGFSPLINAADVNITAIGYMKVSPDGSKLAAAYAATRLGHPRNGGERKTGQAYIYDFDNITGRVSNEKLLLSEAYPYGVEFSPNSKKIYISSSTFGGDDSFQSGEVFQFDATSATPSTTQKLINSSSNVAGALQLAIDGKIYRAGYPAGTGADSFSRLSVIDRPNDNGPNVGYRHNHFDISPKKVKLGLPGFVQSFFNDSFDYEEICFGDATKFEIIDSDYDTVLWDFGDGTSSYEEAPEHVYAEPGSYIVSLTKFVNGIPLAPTCEEIKIFEIPDAPSDYILKNCDAQDGNPNDGLTEFNLQLAKDYLTQGTAGLQVFFYEDRNTAQNDVNNEEALNNVYRNTSPDQQLYAKVSGFGSSCFNITTIRLQTTGNKQINPNPASGCDIGDGIAEFNFDIIQDSVKQELNLPSTVSLSFFESLDDAATGINELPDQYISAPKTIYIRAQEEDACYGYGSIELTLKSLPRVQEVFQVEDCAQNFPINLGTNLSLPDAGSYAYHWNTGEETRTITVNSSGTYTLTLLSSETGCGTEVVFEVQKNDPPQIAEIFADNNGIYNNLEVTLVDEDQEALYSLDNMNGPYQNSPFFRDISGGEHTIYVKSNKSCVVNSQSVFLFGFPKYFSPNEDSYNDFWKPYEISDPDYQIQKILIFDRYGKLLKQIGRGQYWDGSFNGAPMPSDDYWFKVEMENSKVFTGHFSLIR